MTLLAAEAADCQVELPSYTQFIDSLSAAASQPDLSRVSYVNNNHACVRFTACICVSVCVSVSV